MTEEIQPPPPPLPPKQSKALKVMLGAIVGMLPGLMALADRKSDGLIFLFLLSISIWPLTAIILAVIPKSRKFGLGMLLGAGFSLIVLFSVCGGTTVPIR